MIGLVGKPGSTSRRPAQNTKTKVFKYAKRHYRENFNNYTFLENTQNDTDRPQKLLFLQLETSKNSKKSVFRNIFFPGKSLIVPKKRESS